MPDSPENSPTRTLRERIGGRWAIAWQAYLITAGLGLFALLAGESSTTTTGSVAVSWIALWLLASVALGALLLAANVSVFRNRRVHPVAVGWVIAFDGLCGIVFSLVVGIGAQTLALPTNQSILERCVLNVLYAIWWGPALSYFFDYREQAAITRRQLIADSVALELARMQQSEILDRIRTEINEEIGAELNPAREHVEALLNITTAPDGSTLPVSREEWESVSNLLLGTADNSVRPLSKRLWQRTEERYPKTPWWSLVVNIVRYQPFRPFAYALIDLFGTLVVQMKVFGVARGILLLLAGLAITIPVGLLANVLMRRRPGWHAAIFMAGSLLILTSVLVRAELREVWIPGSASIPWQLTQMIASLIVTFATSGFGAWRDKENELRSNVRADIQHDQVESIARSRQVASLARETAQSLHGSVQTRLVTCAMVIEQAAASEDESTLNLALTEALSALGAPATPSLTTSSLSSEVARKVSLWEGFCTFDVQIDSMASLRLQGDAPAVGRVVEEAIANAIRHGKATHIDIDVTADAHQALHVVVSDNGIGPQGGRPGIGSAYLTQVSQGQWAITPTVEGSRLEVVISPN